MNSWLQFKSEGGLVQYERLFAEWKEILDPRLKGVGYWLAQYMFEKYGRPLVISCIGRTETENDAVGGVKWSSHLILKDRRWVYALDFRSRDLPVEEKPKLVQHITETWNPPGHPFLYCLHHDSGAGEHIHINVNRLYRNDRLRRSA